MGVIIGTLCINTCIKFIAATKIIKYEFCFFKAEDVINGIFRVVNRNENNRKNLVSILNFYFTKKYKIRLLQGLDLYV